MKLQGLTKLKLQGLKNEKWGTLVNSFSTCLTKLKLMGLKKEIKIREKKKSFVHIEERERDSRAKDDKRG